MNLTAETFEERILPPPKCHDSSIYLHINQEPPNAVRLRPPAFTSKVQRGVNHSNGPVVYSSVKCEPLQDQSEP